MNRQALYNTTYQMIQGIEPPAGVTWETSAATLLAEITGDGRLVLGDDLGTATPDSLIEAHRSDTSITKPKRGFHALGQISNTLTEITQWVVQEIEIRGANPLSALHTALRVRATNMNTGTPASGGEIRAADIEAIRPQEMWHCRWQQHFKLA